MALLPTKPANSLDDLGRVIADLEAAADTIAEVQNTFYNTGSEELYLFNTGAGGSGSGSDSGDPDITYTLRSSPDPFNRGGESSGDNDVVCVVEPGKVGRIGFANPLAFSRAGLATIVASSTTNAKILIVQQRKVR
jgi:hypothetical protein